MESPLSYLDPSCYCYYHYLTLVLATAVIISFLKRRGHGQGKMPPGPWRLPLLGNIHQIIGPSPHRTFRDLAAIYGPLMHLKMGQVSVIVVSSPEGARDIMATHDAVFANRPRLISSGIMSYGEKDIAFSPCNQYWKQLRKLCAIELLSAKRVLSFRPIREELVHSFISSISSSIASPYNFQTEVFSFFYNMTATIAFGEKNKDQDRFVAIVDEYSRKGTGFGLIDMYPSFKLLQKIDRSIPLLKKLHEESSTILQTIINQHREARASALKNGVGRREDLVDVLLNVQQDNESPLPLSDTNIKAVIHDIFSGGSDTSATLIVWAMTELMKNKWVMEKAQSEVRMVFKGKGKVDEGGLHELEFLKAVIKETLRLHPAAPFLLPRENSERCEVKGYDIPAKTRVLINAWAIGRHPLHWGEDSEIFNPERFFRYSSPKGSNFEYIPFGAGRRMCPGIQFSSIEVELVLAQLLFHFEWKLPKGEMDVDVDEIFGIVLKKKKPLILVPFACIPIPK